VFDMKKTDGIKVLATALALLVTGAAQIAKADDTEIYRVDEEQIGLESVRPKVLIVFDDSGSMRTMVTAQPPEYDPGEDYDAGIPDGRIYWSTNGEPPAANSGQWFLADNNRCGQSFDALDDEGVYVGEFQRWAANPRDWRRLQNRNSTRNSPHIECREDGREGNDDNGSVGDGYADRNVPTNAAVAANTPSNGNFFWRNSRVVTLFTSHRMNYEYDPDRAGGSAPH
jgi:type IV pilus assembly protein PilY1